MGQFDVIFSQHDRPDASLAAWQEQLLSQLRARGLSILLVPHLYHLPETSTLWRELAAGARNVIFLTWLHARPTHWLLANHGISPDNLTVISLLGFTSAEAAFGAIVAQLRISDDGRPASPGQTLTLGEPVSPRWYPVVDGSRCTHCGHCLQFCLFNVYARDSSRKLVVQNPDLCKPGCPACARVCPHGAIMFPLYGRDEAIAGAPGQFCTPDAAAKRMFYAHTGRTCPRCGSSAPPNVMLFTPGSDPSATCPECGRPVSAASASASREAASFDDLDNLIEQLDRTMQQRRR